MINEQTVTDIGNAVRAIRKKGWCQGRFQDDKGRVCLVGAMRLAVYGDVYYGDRNNETIGRYDDMLGLVRQVIDRSQLDSWNDKPGRKRREVVRALQEAQRQATKGT